MATLSLIEWPALHPEVHDQHVDWQPMAKSTIARLPVIYWADHDTWAEANLWSLSMASKSDAKTGRRNMDHLLAYARWLESENLPWWHFPAREADRCLVRFRGALIQARDAEEIAPSTASQRMSAVIRFYRWTQANGLLSAQWPMWSERLVGIRLTDAFGLEHTLTVRSTNLAIPNRKVAGVMQLEDGLLPVPSEGMHHNHAFAEEKASEELTLMLRLGFASGMRLGSITDMKAQTLERASIDPMLGPAWYRLALGPAARPAVNTKFGVSGSVLVPLALLEVLRAYATSTRRLKRQALAPREHRDLLFLTRYGQPYGDDDSRAINVQMSRLREAAAKARVTAFREFHFHRSRATFATLLMRAALRYLPVADAIQFVREACLHRDEATTLKYVKFVETSKAMAEAADAFTAAFMGIAKGSEHA